MLCRFLYLLIFCTSTASASSSCSEMFTGPLFFKEGRWLSVPANELKFRFYGGGPHGYSLRLYKPNEYLKSQLRAVFESEVVRQDYIYVRNSSSKWLKEKKFHGVLSFHEGEWIYLIKNFTAQRPKKTFKDNKVISLKDHRP